MVTVLELFFIIVLILVSSERELFDVYYIYIKIEISDTEINWQRHLF